MESRLWMALDRPEEARAALGRWREPIADASPGDPLRFPRRRAEGSVRALDLTPADRLRIGIAELEWAQLFAGPDEVLRLLSDQPWSSLAGDDDSEWPLYPLWHRGLALERSGDRASAVPLLEAAVRKAQEVFGEGHPRLALVRMSLAFVRWRGGRAEDMAGRTTLAVQMAGVVSDLGRAMPPDAPALRQATVFLAHLRGAPATEDDLKRWRRPEATFHP